MIDSVTVKNFKSLKDVTAPLGLITVLVGSNGSGKSSLLQALILLKQSLGQGNLSWNGPLVALGAFYDLVYRHDTNLEMEISFTGHISATKGVLFGSKEYFFEYKLRIDANGIHQNEGAIQRMPQHPIIRGLWECGCNSVQRIIVRPPSEAPTNQSISRILYDSSTGWWTNDSW